MRRSPAPLTRVSPELAPLWRDGETVQFGLRGTIRVRITEAWTEALIARLCTGIPISTFDVVAHRLGAPRAAARELLRTLRPVLRVDPPPAPPVWIESANVADSRIDGWMRDALEDLGLREGVREDPDAVGVTLVHGEAAAAQLHASLREDLAHLPVAFSAGGATVGPLVVPGVTPCLSCRDGSERDRDTSWPLLHTQLVGRTEDAVRFAIVVQAAGLVEQLLRSPEGTGRGFRSVRLSSDGRRDWQRVRFHEECRCRASSFRSPRGIATVNARHAPLPETRSA